MSQPSRNPASSAAAAFVRRIPALLLIVAAALSVGACHKKDKKKDPLQGASVEKIYDAGHQAMTRANWSKAEATYKVLAAQYPYGPYTEQAAMETAYAQYREGKPEDAISSIDRFIRIYPTQPNLAYMYYLRGLVNSDRDTVWLQHVWRLDPSRRDQSTPQQAYSYFSTVVTRFPTSHYASDARNHMLNLRDMFARHELDTALYYLQRTAYVSAIDRAKYILEQYPQSKYQYDAVAVLGEAYTKLGNKPLADDARRLLTQNDPQHPWLSGHWPHYPSHLRRLNPFAGEKSPVDYEDKQIEKQAKRQQQ